MAISDCFPDLWIDPVAWAGDKEYDVDDATEAVAEASWMLWMLTQQRFTSKYQARRDQYRLRPVERFRLAHGPVDRIIGAVKTDLETNEATMIPWTDLRGGIVKIGMRSQSSDFRSAPRGAFCAGVGSEESVIAVEYVIRPNLPPGAERVTRKLATELYKSFKGQACSLPERITNVTRQGMSWTILDPQDYLQRGLTGLGSVDNWIAAANGRGVFGVLDPLEWLELVDSVVIGCGENYPEPDPEPVP